MAIPTPIIQPDSMPIVDLGLASDVSIDYGAINEYSTISATFQGPPEDFPAGVLEEPGSGERRILVRLGDGTSKTFTGFLAGYTVNPTCDGLLSVNQRWNIVRAGVPSPYPSPSNLIHYNEYLDETSHIVSEVEPKPIEVEIRSSIFAVLMNLVEDLYFKAVKRPLRRLREAINHI